MFMFMFSKTAPGTTKDPRVRTYVSKVPSCFVLFSFVLFHFHS